MLSDTWYLGRFDILLIMNAISQNTSQLVTLLTISKIGTGEGDKYSQVHVFVSLFYGITLVSIEVWISEIVIILHLIIVT